jgi:nitrite reductase/ring-hydroxylating ferredoxin subunit
LRLGWGYHHFVEPAIMPIPDGLLAPGTAGRPFEPVAAVDDVPVGGMLRVTRTDVDLLVAHSEEGICVIDDRCPHMSAPLSIGVLAGCVVACPLHRGHFDLATGETVQFPTTGGLDADGGYHPPWSPPGSPERTEPTDLKAQARALTRVRRLRYYPVRIRSGMIEVSFPG